MSILNEMNENQALNGNPTLTISGAIERGRLIQRDLRKDVSPGAMARLGKKGWLTMEVYVAALIVTGSSVVCGMLLSSERFKLPPIQ